MSSALIFGLRPIRPKYELVLPSEGGEIRLYVMDAKVYINHDHMDGLPDAMSARAAWFDGWGPAYENDDFVITPDMVIRNHRGLLAKVEAVFRLVPDRRSGQTAEIVALSSDGGKTFYENQLCTLPGEFEGGIITSA